MRGPDPPGSHRRAHDAKSPCATLLGFAREGEPGTQIGAHAREIVDMDSKAHRGGAREAHACGIDGESRGTRADPEALPCGIEREAPKEDFRAGIRG